VVGDEYNAALHLLEAAEALPEQDFIVRLLAIWKNTDFEYVDSMVESMRRQPCDLVTAPRDFDVTLAADVASKEAVRRVAALQGNSPELSRARLNPWGFIEAHAGAFDVRWHEPAPVYDKARRDAVLASTRGDPENEFFGREYGGSQYHFLLPYVPEGARVLDFACGSGLGSHLLAGKCSFVLGCDYLEPYLTRARERFPESERLPFVLGDGQSFVWEGGEAFDVVVSLHTLEHVPDDRAMIRTLAANLRPGGMLILELPLLCRRPLGRPVNPHHVGEYTVAEAEDLVALAGLDLVRGFGCSRGFKGPTETARDAVHLHAVKPV
jgi:2-polyprenyl-3-methyl-5-hydroxy-6-metoxy-1,4-benzoquinol methylase